MINILMGGNERAFDGMLIACLSAAKNTKRALSVYILTADLAHLKPSYKPLQPRHAECIDGAVKKYNPVSSVKLLDVTDNFMGKMGGSVNLFNHYTPFAFLRLFAPYLNLPDKIIYLDIDVVVRKDIGELYDIDIDGCELAAAKDYHGQFFIRPSYFNSGVLILNLPELRRSGLFDKTMAYCCQRRMIMPDQSAMNKFVTSIKYISPKFNRQRSPKPDTVIQHFIRKFVFLPYPHIVCVKPWEIGRVHKKYKIFEYDNIFAEYLDILRRFNDDVGAQTEDESIQVMAAATKE